MCPWNWFLVFIQAVWVFLRKKSQIRILYPISHRKGYIHFHCPTPHSSLKNGRSLQKLFFAIILEKYIFFKICYMKNIQNLISHKQASIHLCRQTPHSPQNGPVLPLMVFHNFFNIS